MPHDLFTALLYAQYICGALVLVALLFVTAPYGRHNRPGWGPAVDSKSGWFLMELPAVVTIIAVFALSDRRLFSSSGILLLVWQCHYLYRTFVFSSIIRGSRRTFPLVLTLSALAFNLMNGYINGYEMFFVRTPVLTAAPLRATAGLAVFFCGMAMHVTADLTIRNLRRPGETGYKVPAGGLFTWISSPNYLGEIVEWTGWAILAGTSAGWAFAFFTFCNLFPRALSNHHWYRRTFPDYPKTRRAIFPFVI